MCTRGGGAKIWACTIGYDGTYMHATVKMDSDTSPVSIDTKEIEQSMQSAKAGGRARDC